ncbi:MAG: Ku protein [Smithella sp.]
MPQAIWSGTISFSLVAIPVQLVSAVRSSRVSLHMLHKKDFSPLQRRMVCPVEEKIISPDEIIRGYEIGPEKYILITDEELESLAPERSRTIEISGFIDIKEVDKIHYDHPYYLIPAKGGEKAYKLLAEVLQRTGKAGLARFVLREREYPVAVRSMNGALLLITMHYENEIILDEEILPKEIKIDQAEKKHLTKIIKAMTNGFSPEKYENEHQREMRKLIDKKVKDLAPVTAPVIEEEEEEGEGPPELISILQESMRNVKEKRQ